MAAYTPRTLYESSFAMDFGWEKHLHPTVYKFHDLVRRQLNTPVELQMGTILPFISACCGPRTRSLFFTDSSVLNLFWMNIAASGVGKSQSRKKLITQPLEFMMKNKELSVPDFEVCSFTRAGLQDKLAATGGYCIMTTDEGTGFLDEMSKKEVKHESDISLMNQLFDGQGDKVSLAKGNERLVPDNATCITVSVQPQPFCKALSNMKRTLWLENGFGERFIFTSARPYKFFASEIRKAAQEMRQRFQPDLIGKVALGVYRHHKSSDTLYELSEDAQDYFDGILDNLASQFNSHYDMDDELTESQPPLNDEQRADIDVRTKAAELIGRLSAVLWIYNNAFVCVAEGKPFVIPKHISLPCVKSAESIVNTSYSQAEVYSSALLNEASGSQLVIGKPKFSYQQKVVHAIIRSTGMCVRVRVLVKNITGMTTPVVKAELLKLEEEGYLIYVDKDRMERDKFLPKQKCFSAVVKIDIRDLNEAFFKLAKDQECTSDLYETNFDKDIDKVMRQVATKYTQRIDHIVFSLPSQVSDSTQSEGLKNLKEFRRNKFSKGPRPRNALDELWSQERREREQAALGGSQKPTTSTTSLGLVESPSTDEKDELVVKKPIPYDKLHPPSPKVSKGGAIKRSKSITEKMEDDLDTLSSDVEKWPSALPSSDSADSEDDGPRIRTQTQVLTVIDKATINQPIGHGEGNNGPDMATQLLNTVSETNTESDAGEATTTIDESSANEIDNIEDRSDRKKSKMNAFGSVKTNRYNKREKPPLPPRPRKKGNSKPTRFSQRLKLQDKQRIDQNTDSDQTTDDDKGSKKRKRKPTNARPSKKAKK